MDGVQGLEDGVGQVVFEVVQCCVFGFFGVLQFLVVGLVLVVGYLDLGQCDVVQGGVELVVV